MRMALVCSSGVHCDVDQKTQEHCETVGVNTLAVSKRPCGRVVKNFVLEYDLYAVQ